MEYPATPPEIRARTVRVPYSYTTTYGLHLQAYSTTPGPPGIDYVGAGTHGTTPYGDPAYTEDGPTRIQHRQPRVTNTYEPCPNRRYSGRAGPVRLRVANPTTDTNPALNLSS